VRAASGTTGVLPPVLAATFGRSGAKLAAGSGCTAELDPFQAVSAALDGPVRVRRYIEPAVADPTRFLLRPALRNPYEDPPGRA